MRFILPVAILWTANLSTALAYTFTPIEYPGSDATLPFAIDGNRVVGQYSLPSGGGGAFIYEGGAYSPFTLPEGDVFSLNGIDGPNLVGLMYDPVTMRQRAFWYNGVTMQFVDGVVYSGEAAGVDGIDEGIVVGSSYRPTGGFQAFSFDGTSYQAIDYPTVNFPPGTYSTAFLDIDDGIILGAYEVASQQWQNFLYDGVNFTPLLIPTTTPYISALGIDNGIIVGILNGSGYYYDGGFHMFSHPLGSNGTIPTAISGPNIVGYYADAFGREHGFLVTIPEPPTCLLAVCALPIFAWIGRSKPRPGTKSK